MYKTLSHLKLESTALTEGGMKFLYAEGRTISIARFDDKEAFIAVASMDEQDTVIRIAPGSIGTVLPEEGKDIFGHEFRAEKVDDNTADLTVPAGKTYLIRCPLR